MADTNIVTLSTSSYNQIKNENFRLELFVENLLLEAELSEDRQSLMFDNDKVVAAMKFCFAERYKKKLAHLKGQCTRKEAKNAKTENCDTDSSDNITDED